MLTGEHLFAAAAVAKELQQTGCASAKCLACRQTRNSVSNLRNRSTCRLAEASGGLFFVAVTKLSSTRVSVHTQSVQCDTCACAAQPHQRLAPPSVGGKRTECSAFAHVGGFAA